MPWPPSAACCVAVRAGRIGEVAGDLGVRVDRRVVERREEGEVVHAHRRQALGDRLVVLLEEGLAPVRRGELVELAIHLERRHRLFGVDDAVDLVGRIVAEVAAIGEQRVLVAHHQRVIGVVGVDGDAVAALVRPVEELGDVAHLVPGLRRREVVAVLRLERLHLGRILEPVLAVGPAGCVALGRDRPVLAVVLGVGLDRRRRHDLADLVLVEPVGQVDVVAAGRAGAEPLAVADDHVVGCRPWR